MGKWGHLQRECHRLLDEVFLCKGIAYDWLYKNFEIRHFSSLRYPRDYDKLKEIYRQLFIKSFSRDSERIKTLT
jgi:hypothetical protein